MMFFVHPQVLGLKTPSATNTSSFPRRRGTDVTMTNNIKIFLSTFLDLFSFSEVVCRIKSRTSRIIRARNRTPMVLYVTLQE